MAIQLALFVLGLILVLKGGDLFVDSSSAIATWLNVPRMIVGGTIVSLATTSPEFFVSATASYMGDSGIAVGNALGSAIANIGLIVSVSAILSPISIDLVPFKRRSFWMLFTTVLVFILSWNLKIGFWEGLILLLSAVVYLILNCVKAIWERKKSSSPAAEVSQKQINPRNALILFILGTILVILGSSLLVKSGVAIATALHIPTIIIGLTAVAIGTSLPELITAIKSTRKNVSDLSISNIIGANILNLGLITGVAAMIRPLTVDHFTRYYAFSWVFIMIASMMLIFWKQGRMSKRAGIGLLCLYCIYIIGLLIFSIKYHVEL